MDDPTASIPSAELGTVSGTPARWGPFRLIAKVGQGGFGEVFKAFDPELQREVAVKLLMPKPGRHDEEDLIIREARLHCRIRHNNVVAVHGAGYHDGRAGYWTDFVSGKTLSTLLAGQGRFSAGEAAHIGIEVCKALAAVHREGLLHRDIKASNVMREDGGRILLMDFGLSRDAGQSDLPCGTPPYIAPEVLAEKPATVRSDIYAVGVLLFHLLSGKYPGEATGKLIDCRPDVPEHICRVVSTALAEDPAQRFASAGAMLTALTDALGIPPTPVEARARHRHAPYRWLGWGIGVLVVLLIVVGLVAYEWPKPLQQLFGQGVQDQYLAAEDLLRRYYVPKNVESSVGLFQAVIRDDPKFALAYAGLGRAHWQRYLDTLDPSQIEKARSECKQALALNRELAPAHVTLARIYASTGRSDLASQELSEALALDRRSAEAYGAEAELLRMQGRSAEVERILQKASDLAPLDWRWRNQLGAFYLSVGRPDAAEREFAEAVTLTPDNARAHNNLGVARLRQERYPEARAAFEKAAQLEQHFSHFSNLGAVLQLQGDYRAAASMYQKSIDLNPTNYLAWGNLASVFRWSHDENKAPAAYSKAISLAETTRASRPDDPVLLAQLGSYYAAVKQDDKSIPLLRRAVALAPDDPDVLYFAGEAHELLGRRADAVALVTNALQRGYSREYVRRNPELAQLRSDRRFRLESPSKPQ